ncbi:MAG TPA: hypothetical protein VFQ44_17085 [Streptosporangiaceae bacterium]|nr:hypothetical protein [Streptosporangiaceae bacterium]
MSPAFKLMTVAVATAAAVALPLSTACSAIAAPASAVGGAQHARGSGAGINQGGPAAGKTGPAGPGPAVPAGPAAKPGLAGKPILLDNNVALSGYDIAVDASGRAYIGWISNKNSGGRKVHLCVLPPAARQCKGGIQTIDTPQPFGPSTSTGLWAFATPRGAVTLVWDYGTVASENGPQADEIATATMQPGGHLGPATPVATAPSFGTILDATTGPNGSIWVLTEKSSAGGVQVREGLSGPFVNLHTPFGVGSARLAFSHGTGVLVIQKAGTIGVGTDVATVRNNAFSGFSKVGRTWTGGDTADLTATTSGIRLVATVNNATFHPQILSWNGHAFASPTLTGDLNNCAPASHDLVADASGRAADVSMECPDVAIANLTDTRHAAVTRFSIHGATFAGGPPQIATSPRGTGWVAWSIEGTIEDKLFIAPITLADRGVTASASSRGGKVILHGPASCLPPVDIAVGVTAKAARNWHVVSKSLHLGSSTVHSATLHGAGLTPGKTYTLSGTVRFASGGSHVTVTARLKFRSCPK